MALQQSADELLTAVPILPGRLYFQALQQPFAVVASPTAAANVCYYMDNDLIYEPFCADFGPCNLAHSYRFCQRVNLLLKQVGGWLVWCARPCLRVLWPAGSPHVQRGPAAGTSTACTPSKPPSLPSRRPSPA